MSKLKVQILGKFFDNHSLSIVNRYIALHLKDKCDLYIVPLDNFDPENKLDRRIAKTIIELASKDDEHVIPDIQLRHSYPPIWAWPLHKETKIVYIQPWEFSKVPFEWQYKWETFADAVITPSEWNKTRYLEAGLRPDEAFVVPNGFNEKIFNRLPTKTKSPFLLDNKFTFLFVGNGQHRKGADILITAFAKTFKKADNVQLLIKDAPLIYGNNNLLNELIKVEYSTGCAPMILCNDNLSEEEMAIIYKNSNIIVHPYRGEGFGMHLVEAMACGNVPVVTFGGPPNEFIKESNGYFCNTNRQLVNILDPKLMAAKPGDSFSNMGSHSWILEPEIESLQNIMAHLYHHHDRDNIIKEKQLQLDKYIFTWEQVSLQYITILEKIASNHGTKRHKLYSQ